MERAEGRGQYNWSTYMKSSGARARMATKMAFMAASTPPRSLLHVEERMAFIPSITCRQMCTQRRGAQAVGW
jgi:hypothetical protein